MAGRNCKHAGCTRPHRARGMCNSHYMAWRRANPEILTVQQLTHKTVLEALPGTMRQVAEKTGLHVETVSAALKALNVRQGRQACIYDYLPPAAPGAHWIPLWKEGSGANYRIPTARRKAHEREARRRTRPGYKEKLAAGMIAPALRATIFDILPVAA